MDLPTRKAVVVDDDQDVLSVIVEIMTLLGFDVEGFLCPVAALEHIKGNEVDIVLTDFKMPEMDGFEFVKNIREINNSVPIVMVTGEEDTTVFRQKAFREGVTEMFSKPFDFLEFGMAIRRLVKR